MLALGLAVAGCGGAESSSTASSEPACNTFPRDSRAALEKLKTQSNEIFDCGVPGFKRQLDALAGYPVVVNKWASWCQPCQTEFPVFQRVSVTFGKSVGFMGIDGKDQNPAAAAFLRKFPVTYPSYVDPHEDIARSIHAETYFPQTIYYDRNGKIVFDHAGPYESAAALEKDIRRYALK